MLNLTMTSDYVAHCLTKLGFVIMSALHGEGLPLVAFRLDPKHKHHFDEFAIAHQLRQRSWVVPAYTMAPHSDKLKMMRVVIREDFSRSKADMLIADIKYAVDTLKAMSKEEIQAKIETSKKTQKDKSTKKYNEHYKGEKHSLQGKHGKTHPVC